MDEFERWKIYGARGVEKPPTRGRKALNVAVAIVGYAFMAAFVASLIYSFVR